MFATLPEQIPVSEETLTWIRATWIRDLSMQIPGMEFTYDGTWHGRRGSCDHEAPGMGLLWADIGDCPQCLEVEWPGWSITRTADGYEGTNGERTVYGRTRTRFRCRLASTTTSWGAR